MISDTTCTIQVDLEWCLLLTEAYSSAELHFSLVYTHWLLPCWLIVWPYLRENVNYQVPQFTSCLSFLVALWARWHFTLWDAQPFGFRGSLPAAQPPPSAPGSSTHLSFLQPEHWAFPSLRGASLNPVFTASFTNFAKWDLNCCLLPSARILKSQKSSFCPVSPVRCPGNCRHCHGHSDHCHHRHYRVCAAVSLADGEHVLRWEFQNADCLSTVSECTPNSLAQFNPSSAFLSISVMFHSTF